jgi:hypothetical protein
MVKYLFNYIMDIDVNEIAKRIYKNLLLFCFLIHLDGYAQNYQWAKSVGGKGSDGGGTIKIDALGNIYTLGSFNDTVDFDSGLGVTKLVSTSAWGDLYILKLDSTGSFIWVKRIGGSGGALSRASFDIDASNNIYITGSFTGLIDFDPNIGVVNFAAFGNGYSSFVLKLDSMGNYVWCKPFGNGYGGSVVSHQIVVDNLGFLYGCGFFSTNLGNPVDFDPGSGVAGLTSGSGMNAFVFKWDLMGNFAWVKGYTSPINSFGNCYPSCLSVDNIGNVYTVGYFDNYNIDFDPDFGVVNIIPKGAEDIFISKLNPNGNLSWIKSIGGVQSDGASASKVDLFGNIYVMGGFQDTVDFNPASVINNFISNGSSDLFVLKLNSQGNYIWNKTLGGQSIESGVSLDCDRKGNVYATGCFSNTADFDPSPSIATLTAKGYVDMFIFKLDTAGNFEWAKLVESLDPGSLSVGNSIHIDKSNSIYTSGQYYKSVDFNPDYGAVNQTSFGNYDAFILKLGRCNLTSRYSSDYTICEGETLVISASGAAVYSWSPNGNIITSFTVSPNVATTYTFIETISADCKRTDSISVVIDKCTGFPENLVQENNLYVYPNPNSGEFFINGTEAINFKIINQLGQLMMIIVLRFQTLLMGFIL